MGFGFYFVLFFSEEIISFIHHLPDHSARVETASAWRYINKMDTVVEKLALPFYEASCCTRSISKYNFGVLISILHTQVEGLSIFT